MATQTPPIHPMHAFWIGTSDHSLFLAAGIARPTFEGQLVNREPYVEWGVAFDMSPGIAKMLHAKLEEGLRAWEAKHGEIPLVMEEGAPVTHLHVVPKVEEPMPEQYVPPKWCPMCHSAEGMPHNYGCPTLQARIDPVLSQNSEASSKAGEDGAAPSFLKWVPDPFV